MHTLSYTPPEQELRDPPGELRQPLADRGQRGEATKGRRSVQGWSGRSRPAPLPGREAGPRPTPGPAFARAQEGQAAAPITASQCKPPPTHTATAFPPWLRSVSEIRSPCLREAQRAPSVHRRSPGALRDASFYVRGQGSDGGRGAKPHKDASAKQVTGSVTDAYRIFG